MSEESVATVNEARKKPKPKRKILGERERMCVVCRTLKGKSELIRITSDANGECIVDYTGKAQGRGAYICRTEKCVKAAKKGKSLFRALSPDNAKGKISAGAAFWEELSNAVQMSVGIDEATHGGQ